MSGAALQFACVAMAALLGCGSVAAGGAIFVGTTESGLVSYSSVPTASNASLYLTVGDPPARPRVRRIDVADMRRTPSQAGSYTPLRDPTWERMAERAARAYNVPHALLLAVMHTESHFNASARSPVGAIGLMQVMPPTGRRYGVSTNLADPATNIDVGARYLKDLLLMFNGDERLAVAAYNAGEGAVIKHGRRVPPYAETQAYVPKVMRLYRQYSLAAR